MLNLRYSPAPEPAVILFAKENGVYIFVLKGEVTIEGQKHDTCDGLRIWETDTIAITAGSDTEILLMDIPMDI
ncbi:MAG TPA: hypothetical protein PLL71_01750 [Agriterribacter sp.]|nr:hypothetical protein [Agriterribacter sp.]